jgi:chromosome partitioning protein
MARIISFINYKGGVGKTTTTYHVGCALAYAHDKKVLLVDIDPQCNLTLLCAVWDRWRDYVGKGGTSIATLYERYLSGKPFISSKNVWKSPIQGHNGRSVLQGVDLLPSAFDLLVDFDISVQRSSLSNKNPLATQLSKLIVQAETYVIPRIFMRKLLSSLSSAYDYILIDCPPNLYILTQNALLASDYYVVTALPDHLSTIGISLLMQGVDKITAGMKKYAHLIGETVSTPALGGILFVRVLRQQPTRMHRETMNQVSRTYPASVFDDYTTELTGYQEASAEAVPVFLHASENAARAKDQYLKITNEFLRRCP